MSFLEKEKATSSFRFTISSLAFSAFSRLYILIKTSSSTVVQVGDLLLPLAAGALAADDSHGETTASCRAS